MPYGECVFSSEIDKHAIRTYQTNFNETPSGDIRLIPETEIPPHDIICAGFPCQTFSTAGKKQGFADTRGTLFHEIIRIAAYHKPKLIFLENVRNLLRHDSGRTFEIILKSLESLKYTVYYSVLNASYYGIPQSRQRIYIVAFKHPIKFNFPTPTYKQVRVSDILEPNAEKYIKTPPEITWLTPTYHPYKPLCVGVIKSGAQGYRIYSPEGHAITLTASGGGLFAKTGGYLIDGATRTLSPRECARLMGFPDTFTIPVSDTQAKKQFGNSIVIPLVNKILFQALEGVG